ncbi:hypothetical protein B0A48_04992 [Cryoendolithus antarcticus]|uniref:Autophagy-related protein 18 n=1 Tax=Cryoendolithus antarcticus TaxID=1507870 RepID=A0A1V8TDY0_9PEZI|nr:hypothetical protein B0A48_04992 [Cryoendolithus antarcticus]
MAGLNYVAFNQDHSQLAVATTRGLRVYQTDPFELQQQTYEEDISLVEQLFSTSLVALILTPRLLRIVNTKRKSTICELTFHGMVVSLKMNRKRLVIVLEETVFIYDLSNMKMLHSQLTPLNPAGICAVSPNSENNYLALPHYQKSQPGRPSQPAHVPSAIVKETISGDVLLYELNKMEEVTVIPAHQTPVSCIALNNDGTLMATSSEKGTIIRIFAIPTGKKLFQFRRGSMPARIYSMSFNSTSTLLCVSSATETVHIFKLAAPSSQTPHNGSSASPPGSPTITSSRARERSTSPSASETTSESPIPDYPDPLPASTTRPPNFMSMIRRTSQNVSTGFVSRAAGYLPSSVTEMWEPQRDFAWVRIPRVVGGSGAPVKSVVAMGSHAPSVMVATSEGGFYVFGIDLEKGGEGTLVRRFDDIHGIKHLKGQDIDE